MRRRPHLETVTSRTTRPPRPGDGVGKAYEHVSPDDFERLRASGGLLESAVVHGELYGTPREPVERLLGEGRDVLLEIDLQGARQVKSQLPDAVTIFLEPPSWEALEDRLRARRTEDDERLRRRLETAKEELAAAGEFDHQVVNDQLERAVDQVNRILEQGPQGEKRSARPHSTR